MATVQYTETGFALETPAERFINRELSWLAFNQRVLEEACNQSHPLLERLRFLSICASNLDEFYTVRVAGIKGQIAADVTGLSPDGLTPAQQYKAINEAAVDLMRRQRSCWLNLAERLRKQKIFTVEPDDLSATDRDWLAETFERDIFPILTPIACGPTHPFPFVPSGAIALALKLTDNRNG
ncbi:MAG: RNA degradosome polyphosphate kinase, partial [Pseudomonadota bacterium]|nr:RNA degradosome polyphosphate kinase [Pseudomonadota bacterium]